MRIPALTGWLQTNIGDTLGSLFGSFNLDLISRRGKVRVSSRLVKNVDSSDLSNLGLPAAITISSQATSPIAYIWVIAGARVFYSVGGPNTAFIQDATSGTPTSCSSDISDFSQAFGNTYVSQSTSTIKYINSGVWSSFTAGSGGGLGQMLKFGSRVYKVDNNNKDIISWDSSHTVASAGTQYTLQNLCDNVNNAISWIAANSSRIFIGTVSYNGTPGIVYGWDGSQTTINETYLLDDAGSLAGVIKNNTPWIFDVSGRLSSFNGGSFREVTRIPLENTKMLGSYFGNRSSWPVHYNGIKLIDGRININILTTLWDTDGTIQENIPSGIWEYDENVGFYHKQSFGLSKSGDTITDYGASKLSAVGAISAVKFPSNNLTQGSTNGLMMAGATFFTDATTTRKGLYYNDSNDTLQKSGYLLTNKIYSQNIADAWNTFWLRNKKLLTSTDRIKIKYRTSEVASIEQTITWTNSTVFSTTLNTGIAVGDEVEILQGTGAGIVAHITAIETSGGNYNITMDTTFTGISNGLTGKARFQKWILLDTISDQITQFNDMTFGENDKSPWVQLKIYMLFTGRDEFYDLFIDNQTWQKP